MIALLTLFNVIALIALLDLNKRVDELEQEAKVRKETTLEEVKSESVR